MKCECRGGGRKFDERWGGGTQLPGGGGSAGGTSVGGGGDGPVRGGAGGGGTVDVVNGNLVLTAKGGSIDDDWTIKADGTNLTITDNHGTPIDLLGVLNGGTGDATASVTIPLSHFPAGKFEVTALGGDDKIEVAGLTLADAQSLKLDGGTGSNKLLLTGDHNKLTLSPSDSNSGKVEFDGKTNGYVALEPILGARNLVINLSWIDFFTENSDIFFPPCIRMIKPYSNSI